MGYKNLKIAIVHDHLGFRGGGERTVLLLALELGADFITAYAHPETYGDYQSQLGSKLKILTKRVITTRVVRFFWLRSLFWRNRKIFKNYDIIIASSQIATEAVAEYSSKKTLRMVYTHSTPRRVFDMYDISKRMYPFILQPAYAIFARFWKHRYLKAIRKFDINIANSENVRQRVKDHTGGDVNLVAWPPIMTDKFKHLSDGDYYLSFGRIDEAKRIELIVEAFKQMPEKKLVIASGGPRLEKIREMAMGVSNIEIVGWVSDEDLIKLVGNALATVYIPIDEDAGMTHLESNMAGKPYLGVKEGGLVESTIDGETGVLIPANPQINDVISGIRMMTKNWCLERREKCQLHAKRYDQKIFFNKIEKLIDENNPQIPVMGIDASRWEDPRFPGEGLRTGVEVYAKNVVENLIKEGDSGNLRYRIYTPHTIPSLPLSIQKVIPAQSRWTNKWLARELRYSPVDYFFTPSYYIPKHAPIKSFAVIHDVIFRTNPEKYSFKERLIQELVLRANIKRSHKIFTVSQYSKREIMREYKLADEKIVVIPMGYDRQVDSNPDSKISKTQKEKIILYLGRIETKKSVDLLIEAFAAFSKFNAEWQLVLAGKDGFGSQIINEKIDKLGVGNRVKKLGYVSEDEKWKLLRKSRLVVHPSALEGSAIPILEAWDAETAVIASEATVIKEIGQDGVCYFKVGDAKDLCLKIGFIINDSEENIRLISNGKKLLENYSWKRTVDFLLNNIIN